MKKEELIQLPIEQLIKMYKEFDFKYTECGSKKIFGLTPSKQLAYEKKSQEEIDTIAEKRVAFETLSLAIIAKFRELYQARKRCPSPVGADRTAAYIAPEEKDLLDLAIEIMDMGFEKDDPLPAVCILQTTELAFYYRGRRAFDLLKKICSETFPQIAISCDVDPSIYIPDIVSRFCVLEEISPEYYIDLYLEGLESQRKLKIQQLSKRVQPTYGEDE